jgi:hypothetical protein
VAEPRKIGFVNAANGPITVSCRSSARTYAAYDAVVRHSTVLVVGIGPSVRGVRLSMSPGNRTHSRSSDT